MLGKFIKKWNGLLKNFRWAGLDQERHSVAFEKIFPEAATAGVL